jgi:hypothetical protein
MTTYKRLIGSDPNQVSLNRDLGSMAFQDSTSVSIGNSLNIGINGSAKHTGQFSNATPTALLAFTPGISGSTNQIGNGLWAMSQNTTIVNNSTVDVFRFLDSQGSVMTNQFVAGHFYINSICGGGNQYSAVYTVLNTGNGTSPASLTAVSTITRATSPVSSISIANDGASGAIKLQIAYINNSGVITSTSTTTVSFVGNIF